VKRAGPHVRFFLVSPGFVSDSLLIKSQIQRSGPVSEQIQVPGLCGGNGSFFLRFTMTIMKHSNGVEADILFVDRRRVEFGRNVFLKGWHQQGGQQVHPCTCLSMRPINQPGRLDDWTPRAGDQDSEKIVLRELFLVVPVHSRRDGSPTFSTIGKYLASLLMSHKGGVMHYTISPKCEF
jgi:hypothetical protein